MLQNIAEDYEYLMIMLIVMIFVGTGSIISWIFLRPSNKNLIQKIEGIVPPFLGLPAVLFSLTAALMATSLWENYNVAIKAVRNESQSIATLIELSDTISGSKGLELKRYAKEYAQSVVSDEWPTLSHNDEESPATQRHFDELRAATFTAIDSLQGTAKSQALMSAFQGVNDGRKTRLSFVSFDVHPVRWYAMLILAVLVQLAVALVHTSKPRALVVAVGVATITVLIPICAIAFTLSSPYVGVVSISNMPFLAAIR